MKTKLTLLFVTLLMMTISFLHSDELDILLENMMETNHLPGLAAMIVKDNQIVWQNCYGFADIDENRLVTDSTLFMVASISKTFVGTALMQLWENGYFQLDDNINNYLDFSIINPFYPVEPITFRELMTHMSAIKGDFHADGLNLEPDTWGYDHPTTMAEFLPQYFLPGGEYYLETNFNNYEPGSEFDYSSVASTVAAYMVERISGMTFEDYCQQHIFQPLGMNHTSWFLANIDVSNLASHYWWQNGTQVEYPPRGCVIYPCGWLKTSISQLKNYLYAFMNKGICNETRILEETTVDSMLTLQYPDVPVYFPGYKWGLMWYRYIRSGRTLWGHEGGSIGVTTLMYFCPAENSGVIMLSNGMSADCMKQVITPMLDYAENIQANDNYNPEAKVSVRTYPNPFYLSSANRSSAITISFTHPSAQNVNIDIFDIKGKHIKKLQSETLSQEETTIIWKADDDDCNKVSSGIYLYKLKTEQSSFSGKILILR